MNLPGVPHLVRLLLIGSAVAAATVVANPLAASADTVMDIPVLSQQDGAWAGAALGYSPTDTIGSSGCAITSVTMMLRYYGISTDPGALNWWLSANGAYLNGDQLIWDAVNFYTGGKVNFSGWLGPNLGVIQSELDAGRPVIAEVSLNGNQHFVLIIGYSADGGLRINDPWFGDTVNFGDRYGDPSSGILSMRTFMPADPPVRHSAGGVR